MVRLRFFVEGITEQTFADNVLKPHLAGCKVYMHKPVLVAHCRKKGQVHRGGGRRYLPMRNDILRFLKQETGEDVFFTTMIDLYGIHGDFPGIKEAEKFSGNPHARVTSLESAWSKDIGDQRFIPYIQLHEFEGLLFTNPAELGFFYPDAKAQIKKLKAISDGFQTPELINDGPETSPSKRIIAEFPAYKGAKSVVGPQVAEIIGLDGIRLRCPHFNGWISKLEKLASREG